MPIYEYYCLDCRQRVNVFFRTVRAASSETPQCPECHSENLHRLMSRVRVLRSEESRIEDLADPALISGLEQEDPRALAGFMRRMSDEMGEPMDAEMNEVVDRLEAGEDPDAIEDSLPTPTDSADFEPPS